MKQSDIQQIVDALKPIFGTKEDLQAMEKRQDEKYATKGGLEAVEERLTKKIEVSKKEIVQEVTDYIHDELYPLMDGQETRIKKIERHLGLNP